MTVVAMLLSLSLSFVLVTTMQITSASAAATCLVGFGAQGCVYSNTKLTMTYPIMLRVSDAAAGASTFTANVMLRGGTEGGRTPTTPVVVTHATDGSDGTIDVEHVFDPYDSVNYMGYTVAFDADLGCKTSFYEKYFSITVGGGRCIIDNTVDVSEIPDGTFIDDNAIATSVPTTDEAAEENSNPPTIGSTPSPITPIVTAPPPSSMSPTIKPSTSPIMVIIPLIPPTILPTSLSTPNPIITLQPSGESTSIVSSPAPSNVGSPSSSSSSSLTYTAPSCIMQLLTAEYMDGHAKDIWISVTSKTIRNEVAYQVGGALQRDLITVAITITKQERLSESRRIRRKLKKQQQQQRRNLHSTTTPSTSPLTISFSTVITFPSTTRRREEGWSVIELVGGGFTSIKEQEYYISQLVSADEVGDFDSVNSMELIVDGKTVTDDVGEENNTKSPFILTIPTIVGAAVGGVGVLLLSAVFFVLCRKRRRERGDNNDNDHHVKRSSYRPKSFHNMTTTNGVDNRGSTTENPTTSDDNNTLMNPQSYFGTINPTDDGDDVSTLGDPYVGELISPAAMDATTVASGGLMSLQEKLFVYGVSGLSSRVGSTGVESRMGDTMLTGSKTMMFGDDATLEAMYQTTTQTTEQTPAILDFITIVAPSGVLGVVLNNTGVEFPIVFAVKDSSPLYGRVEVGDMLVSVDEVHCQGMSSHTVSSFLSSRSQNPGRKLTLARASVDTRSTA